jgi:hypothetical protein
MTIRITGPADVNVGDAVIFNDYNATCDPVPRAGVVTKVTSTKLTVVFPDKTTCAKLYTKWYSIKVFNSRESRLHHYFCRYTAHERWAAESPCVICRISQLPPASGAFASFYTPGVIVPIGMLTDPGLRAELDRIAIWWAARPASDAY